MKASNRRYINKQTFVAAISMVASFACFFVHAQKLGDSNISFQQVQQAFATNTNQEKHPRLFFDANDIERVKKLLQQKDSLVVFGYKQLEVDAKQTLQQPLLTYYLDAAKLRVPSLHTFAKQIPALVMMYQLTGDTVYASRVYKQLQLMESYPDWGANRHFLDAGIGAFDFALAYDGLHNYLSAEQRAVLRSAVRKHVFEPGRKQLEKREWWATAKHNWNGICNGGLIMAALAMYEDDPNEMSNIVAMAANGLPHYIKAFEPDGQSEEGLMYWSYGLMYTTIALESMQRTLGTTFSLDQFPGFKKAGWFPAYVSGPVTSLSIGDDPVKKSRSRSFFWFAKNNKDTALAKMQYDLCLETNTVSWMDMLYYDAGMQQHNSKAKNIGLQNYIHGIEIMSLRDGWHKNAFFISMHGGDNFANHGHLDAGSFDIQAMGEVWAYGSLGSDNYTYPGYFSKQTNPAYNDPAAPQKEAGRWHFYRLRTAGKNCVVFNTDARPEQDERSSATLKSKETGKDENSYTLDLSNCYNRDVKEYSRTISLNNKREIATVTDSIIARKPTDLWWSMHTKATIDIAKDGQSAILMINNKKMKVKIVSPALATFQEMEADYLPGEQFPLSKNASNKEYKKLAIHLTSQEVANIQVRFQPL